MLALVLVLYGCLFSWSAYAQTVFLDTQLNTWLEELAEPLLKSANLAPGDILFGVIADDDPNAFAIPGRQIYFHSGLILEAKSVAEIRGVMAHEIGHVIANHHFERADDLANLRYGAIAGAIAGLGAALAGSGDAAVALLLGGQGAGVANLLRHSRTQEREADQIAIQLLHSNTYSTQGMVDLFKRFNTQMLLTSGKPPAHLLTHPLPPERLSTLSNIAQQEDPGYIQAGPTEDANFALIQAKLFALTRDTGNTRRKYMGNDLPDQLARSIADAREGRLDRANATLAGMPDLPWVQDLRGHIALEQGDFSAAVAYFQDVRRAFPNDSIAALHLARAYQAANSPEFSLPIAQHLTIKHPDWAYVWYLVGINAGRLAQYGTSHLALTEHALLRRDVRAAEQQLTLAQAHLTPEQQVHYAQLEERVRKLQASRQP